MELEWIRKTENRNCSAHKMLMVFIACVPIWGN